VIFEVKRKLKNSVEIIDWEVLSDGENFRKIGFQNKFKKKIG